MPVKKGSKVNLCENCGEKTVRGKFEGFSTENDRHYAIKICRYCKKCNILYVNPNINPQIKTDLARYYDSIIIVSTPLVTQSSSA